MTFHIVDRKTSKGKLKENKLLVAYAQEIDDQKTYIARLEASIDKAKRILTMGHTIRERESFEELNKVKTRSFNARS